VWWLPHWQREIPRYGGCDVGSVSRGRAGCSHIQIEHVFWYVIEGLFGVCDFCRGNRYCRLHWV